MNRSELKPFKVAHHQALRVNDPARRVTMCEWFVIRIQNVANPGEDIFVRVILFSDECTFQSNGTTNRHNAHHWSSRHNNPHCFQDNQRQGHFFVRVWAGLVDDFVVGPYIWPNNVTVTTEEYSDFLDHELPQMLDDLPLQVRAETWFQQDGHPAHTSLAARAILNREYPNKKFLNIRV
ncbi:hypothetical protein FOCC_FOCC014184 [Frankliniella occidentalis]|nr:hypothetical protein FOCC_FOCC014184 [Frankliniella occidentalis]